MYSLSNYHLAFKKIGSLVDTIINAFKKIVLNDGGTFEDSICLNSKLSQLTNSDISLFSEYSNTVNNTLGMVEPSESTSFETDYNKYTNGVTPSLLLIPNGRKFDTLYSAIGTNLTFSGTGDKSRINKAGNIEFTKRNLYQFSEDYTNGYWNINPNGTLASNVAIAPDGSLTADSYTKTSGVNTVASISRTSTVYPITGIYTLSVYFKNINSNTVLVRLDSSGNTANVTYNFNTKILTNSGTNILGSSVMEVGNGWIRVIATANITSTTFTTDFANLFPEAAGAQVYVWGVQIEKNSSASVYQKTTTSNLTARIDYSNTSAALLLEPSRTNLVLNSSDVTQATWNKTRVTVANTSNTTPIVGVTARKITVTSLGALRCNQVITGLTAGARYVYKQYIKKDNLDTVTVIISDSGEAVILSSLSYTFSTNSFTGDNGIAYVVDRTSTILSDGWVLIKIYIIIPTGQTTLRFNSWLPGASFAQAVAIGDAVFVTNAQIEAGVFDTSDIITTNSIVTRVGDSAINNNATSFIGQGSGTVFVNYIPHTFGVSTGRIFVSTDDTLNSRIWLAYNTNNTITCFIRNNSGVIYTNNSIALQINGLNKIAIAYANNDIRIYLNGVLILNSSANLVFNQNRNNLYIGSSETSNDFNQIYIKSFCAYLTILTDSQCISLTT